MLPHKVNQHHADLEFIHHNYYGFAAKERIFFMVTNQKSCELITFNILNIKE